jgi:hypothetical protein
MHALTYLHAQEHTKEETSAPMLASVKKSDSDTNLREKFAAGATTFSYHKKRKTEVCVCVCVFVFVCVFMLRVFVFMCVFKCVFT